MTRSVDQTLTSNELTFYPFNWQIVIAIFHYNMMDCIATWSCWIQTNNQEDVSAMPIHILCRMQNKWN